MPYDFTHLDEYLRVDTHLEEVIQLLRYCRYALVCCAEYLGHYEGLSDRYLSLLQLEEEFLRLNDQLSKIRIRWR